MNSLSWLLYAGDALGSLRIAVIFISIGCLIFGIARSIGAAFYRDKWNYRALYREETEGKPKPPAYWPYKQALASAIFLIVAAIIPSSSTIYMIAASELGERAVKSPDGAEMIDLLRKKVREVLKEKAQ